MMRDISAYLATNGSHVCSCWPCPQTGMHHIPNGLWPTTERLNLTPLTRATQKRRQETSEQREERLAIARQRHAATLAQHRHKALAARENNRAQRVAEIAGKFDVTRHQESIAELAREYKYTPECMRKLLVRHGVNVPSMRGKRRQRAEV